MFDIGQQRKPRVETKKDKKQRTGSGRRAKTLSTHSGRYVKAKLPMEKTSDIAIDATLRASVSRNGNLSIEQQDIREKVREKKSSSVIVFVVDASGSMGAAQRMEAAKGAVMALLNEAYQKRDKVSFVAFRKEKAEVLLPPTSSTELAARYLRELPTGGKTPLPDGLFRGLQVLENEKKKNSNIVPILLLISDGKGNVPIGSKVKEEVLSIAGDIKKKGINLVIIDSGVNGLLSLGYNREIAEVAGGQLFNLDELDAVGIVDIVKPMQAYAGRNEVSAN